MTLERGSVKHCGNTVTTKRGTYTFYNQRITKSQSAKLCKTNGGILATLNTQEEFEAVHKFAYECEIWSGIDWYHVGLYVYGQNERFYTDCTKWDPAKHSKMYWQSIGNGPCWKVLYRSYDKLQAIYSDYLCMDDRHRTICFNAFDNATTNAGGIVQSNVDFSSFNVLTLLIATVAIGLAIVSMKKNRKYEEELAEVKQQMKL